MPVELADPARTAMAVSAGVEIYKGLCIHSPPAFCQSEAGPYPDVVDHTFFCKLTQYHSMAQHLNSQWHFGFPSSPTVFLHNQTGDDMLS